MDYQYPISHDWTTEEVISVINFYEAIERVYEKGVQKSELLAAYRKFKEVVPGKADEKKLGDQFEKVSGYSLYQAIKKMKNTQEDTMIKL
ncbi:UPF0223 family protein [Bacillus sp. FJAT-50079]|uniref:UPF0223 family protein n=1 Tax=Bacillus sp. FJAT-50079 TaxID=2833577 RepID=UPI001BCA0B50|nr:UPF0223 family protein [Bacillus sp. FJAT-50079]MBS4207770.1 UPF0223 family protein [Bacillus sp. FJAT-50079]